MDEILRKRQKQFRITGVVTFVVAMGLLLCRILVRFLPSEMNWLLQDAIFTVLIQAVFLLTIPFLIYKFALKKSVKSVLEFSNVRKFDWRIGLLCIPLGICVLIVTMGVSTMWMIFLTRLGYSPSSGSGSVQPFNALVLLADVALTAVFPAVCEEFTNRGGLLTTLRSSFSRPVTIVISGLWFGLFHQNVTQLFYPFLFGMLMAGLTIRTKSIFPAVIIHFVNNALSVYIDYAQIYPVLPLHEFIISMEGLILNAFPVVVMMFFMVFATGAFLYWAIIRLTKKKESRILQRVTIGSITIVAVEEQEIVDKERPLEDKTLYKPTVRDWAFYIGALVVTVLSTVVSFVWGLL